MSRGGPHYRVKTGEEVRAYLASKKMTQVRLCVELNVGSRTVWSWLTKGVSVYTWAAIQWATRR